MSNTVALIAASGEVCWTKSLSMLDDRRVERFMEKLDEANPFTAVPVVILDIDYPYAKVYAVVGGRKNYEPRERILDRYDWEPIAQRIIEWGGTVRTDVRRHLFGYGRQVMAKKTWSLPHDLDVDLLKSYVTYEKTKITKSLDQQVRPELTVGKP